MITLGIDTANQTLAVGITEDGNILGQIQINKKKNHSVSLMPAIEQLFQAIELEPTEVDRIVVSDGPGSYTGLRIGVTTAKTLAYTLNKELVGVSSLQAIAANCVNVEGLIVPLFDARRKNVYAGVYRQREGEIETVLEDVHISIVELLDQLKQFQEPILFVGVDVQKFTTEIEEILPTAKINHVLEWNLPNGITIATLGSKIEPTKDIQNFLPRYLKKVEAEEKWLETHTPGDESYVEKI
ncbi:tRNA (adenosine(37)-N6)-threonylcarbamoyltransferase complex dimerization subunit type 1 TsaB [Enterococcus villorum]|uniref:tRNA (Adenosine(37)-N6)-threonylcarbamoyltransferase complex dimerization subunit type 1 TsaB n=2 Tax=Enterococcus villorum TaxID=112904 RepID=A0A511J072_9ENTE|nr:tRNA (adenosine(37)-N6)-threonylcarbamoyltransferase complex dimerization subunit type 1 TsaB [Enterococcus villorum]EOH87571.1 universal bacterial protein YeaZ [Enterococcus villorum ATCC 700913]EOW77710.1 universal bacterial protein YeaZ [Enterococcus villorum ATCC 700913]GEL91385.1 tRNA (adenosine(37)-N6)-threonylcarbamoyltransferase complex dimerization subunit type 1 TsaB [Enterococcus villorum]